MLPTVILPGYFESADLYLPLQQALIKIGTPTTTVPLRIRDWFPTVGGRFSWGEATPTMVPILRQLDYLRYACANELSMQLYYTIVDFIGEECVVFFASLVFGFTELPLSGDQGIHRW